MSRVTTVLFILVICVLLLAACSTAAETEVEDATAEAAVNEVTFTAVEYSFEGPESISAGWTRLRLDNQGERSHDLIPVKLGEGKTVDDVMAALELEGPPEWATIYGQVTAESGQSASYLVDLAPGNYVLLSFGDSEDGPPDAAQGMIHTLTVTEGESEVTEADLPLADASVDLVDYSFVVDGDIETGEQLLYLHNTGTEMHELSIVRLKEGTSFADIQAMLESGEEYEGEPPFEDVGFMLLSPGISTYVPMDFEKPGTYVLTCFIPSVQHEGMPHYELGMIQEITVQ
jgi:hypothetical protein